MNGRKIKFINVLIIVFVLLGLAFLFIATGKPMIEGTTDISAEQSNSPSKEVAFNDSVKASENVAIYGSSENYESSLDFPYPYISFVTDDIFKEIKDSYAEIEFYSEFLKGDLRLYDDYKNAYDLMLKNENTFLDATTNKELFFNEYESFSEINLDEYIFYFFDFDGDDGPELCVSDGAHFIYIFKYVPSLKKVVLWHDEMTVTWYGIMGSKTISWVREGIQHLFYKLDGEGNELYSVHFFSREGLNKQTGQGEVVYMVTFPRYADHGTKREITENMKKEAYFAEGEDEYYFRVTEEQFNELTKDYFEAQNLSDEEIKEVRFTYKELFNYNSDPDFNMNKALPKELVETVFEHFQAIYESNEKRFMETLSIEDPSDLYSEPWTMETFNKNKGIKIEVEDIQVYGSDSNAMQAESYESGTFVLEVTTKQAGIEEKIIYWMLVSNTDGSWGVCSYIPEGNLD